jgi:hypothetical protein
MQLAATFASGQVGDIRYVGPDREALDAVAPAFRELYGGGRWNHTSAAVIAKLICHHAHAASSEPGRQLAEQLRDFRRALKNRAKTDPRMGILVEQPGNVGSSSSLAPNEAIDLLLNGDLFHYELKKADEFEGTPLYEQSLVMMVHSAIRDFAPLWQKLDRIVSAILIEPRLLEEASAA